MCTAPGFLDTEQDVVVIVGAPAFLLSVPRDGHFGEYPDSGPPLRNRSWSLYGPRLPIAGPRSSSCGSPLSVDPRLRRRSMAEPLDQPLGVVPRDELTDEAPRLFEGPELVQVDALLLERAHEALRDAIALQLGPRHAPRDRDCPADLDEG